MSGDELEQNNSSPDGSEREQNTEAVERLNESNRVLVEARMLPKDGKLSQEQIENVVIHFKSFIGKHEISLQQVARGTGVSTSVLSEWKNAKYGGDVDKITRAVNDWMEREGRRRQSERPKDYVETWLAETIRTYSYLADKRVMMAALVVPAGAGKTKVLKILTEEMRGLYVYCEQGMSSRDLFQAIAEQLGYRQEGGTRSKLRKFIIGELKGTSRILFLDEAHALGKDIGAIRSIHDEAQVAIVMAGTDEILRHVNDRVHGRGQFSSRCIRWNALDYVHNVEGSGGGSSQERTLFTLEEIKAFFAMKKIRLNGGAIEMLWALACLPNHGTFRFIEHIVETALDKERDAGQFLTRDDIVQALYLLVGADSKHVQRLAGLIIDRERRTYTVAKAG